MKYRTKQLLSNIPPENRLSFEEKLKEKGYNFQRVLLHKYKGRIGVFCPDLYNTFAVKQYCKSCKRHLGGSGKFFYCKKK